jgi:hypothetical protein
MNSELWTYTSSHYRLDWFHIFILVSGIIAFIYIIIASVYFAGLINMLPPNITESKFLFFSGIIIAIWFAVLIILTGLRIAKPVHVVYHHNLTKDDPDRITYPVDVSTNNKPKPVKKPEVTLPIGTHAYVHPCIYNKDSLPTHYYNNTFV